MPYLAANMHPSGETLLANLDHIAKVAGEDHVAIGTDGGVLPLVIDAKAREDARKDFEQVRPQESPLPVKDRTFSLWLRTIIRSTSWSGSAAV